MGLEAYDAWKKRRRVVDFVDMVDCALTLTGEPAVADELRARLKLLVVDEFQDTSPVQLALFARLHALAGRSTWVGDRKQCIFEFAGSDPSLMEAVTTWAGSAGTVQQLEHNWRSRPALVAACTHLFSGAFARHGFDAREVTVSPKRGEPPELASLPPFGVWSIAAGNKAQEATALAEGVRRFLADPAASPVMDRTTGRVRNVRPGDIAILVASNAEADAVSDALATLGIRTNVARVRLLGTPEGTMLSAALRVLLDSRDALPQAVLHALTGFEGSSPEAWLADRLAKAEADKAAKEAGEPRAAAGESEILARVRALAREVETLGPVEVVDRLIGALDLPALVSRWPDPAPAGRQPRRASRSHGDLRGGVRGAAGGRDARRTPAVLRGDGLRAPRGRRDARRGRAARERGRLRRERPHLPQGQRPRMAGRGPRELGPS